MQASPCRHSFIPPNFTALVAFCAFATIAASSQAETLAAWTERLGVPADLRGAMDSPAGDGVTNLMKYALGVPPLESAAQHMPKTQLIEQGGAAKALELIFPINPNAQNLGSSRFVVGKEQNLRYGSKDE